MRRLDLLAILFFVALASCFLPNAYEAYAIARGEYISANAMSQRALFRYLERIRDQDNNRAMTSAGLNLSTTHAQIKNDVHYLIDGGFYKIAASDTPTYDPKPTTQSVATYRYYVYCAGAAATASVYAGSEAVAAADASYPTIPDGLIPFSKVRILTNATDAFVYGTTSFSSATAVTTNFSFLEPYADSNYQDL